MKTIRHNVFETNSSSCHSITILSPEQYDKLIHKNGFCINEVFYERENVKNFLKKEISTSKWFNTITVSDNDIEEFLDFVENIVNNDYIKDLLELMYDETFDSSVYEDDNCVEVKINNEILDANIEDIAYFKKIYSMNQNQLKLLLYFYDDLFSNIITCQDIDYNSHITKKSTPKGEPIILICRDIYDY